MRKNKAVEYLSPIGTAISLAFRGIVEPLEGRKNVISTHWDFYCESGILKYLAGEVRRRFNIPKLNPEEDISTNWIPVNEVDDTEATRFKWYETYGRRAELAGAINEILSILYLPKNSFEFVLYYVL